MSALLDHVKTEFQHSEDVCFLCRKSWNQIIFYIDRMLLLFYMFIIFSHSKILHIYICKHIYIYIYMYM